MTRSPAIVIAENISRESFIAAIKRNHARDPVTGLSRVVAVVIDHDPTSPIHERATVAYTDGTARTFQVLAHPGDDRWSRAP